MSHINLNIHHVRSIQIKSRPQLYSDGKIDYDYMELIITDEDKIETVINVFGDNYEVEGRIRLTSDHLECDFCGSKTVKKLLRSEGL
jgi:hypothetical protein